MPDPERPATTGSDYTGRLVALQAAWWKRLLDVQAPYRWNLKRLQPGYMLDVGCGVGRNLAHVDGHGVGVDHNPHSVEVAVAAGYTAMTPTAFERSALCRPHTFDSILLAHVLEHMVREEMGELIGRYLDCLRPGGQVIVITPQERGHASDPTHVTFLDREDVQTLLAEQGLRAVRSYSFPLPRWAGRWFVHNELVTVGRR